MKQISKLNKLGRIIRKIKRAITSTNGTDLHLLNSKSVESLNEQIKKINKTITSNLGNNSAIFSTIPRNGHVGQLKNWIYENLSKWCIFCKLLKENINEGIKERIKELITKRYKDLQDNPKYIIDSILK